MIEKRTTVAIGFTPRVRGSQALCMTQVTAQAFGPDHGVAWEYGGTHRFSNARDEVERVEQTAGQYFSCRIARMHSS